MASGTEAIRTALCTLVALIGLASAASADITVSDPSFSPGNWSASVYFQVGGIGHSEVQVAAGGNPGEHRFMTHTVASNSTVGLFHRYLAATYVPSVSGAIVSLDYSEDRIQVSPPFVGAQIGANPALIQDGVVYFGPDITFGSTNWTPLSRPGLTAVDFSSSTATHPDFSSTGGPIQFGYARSNTSTANGFVTQHAVDNWSFALHTAPISGVDGHGQPEGPMLRIQGPNPFAERSIAFELSRPAQGHAAVRIFDATGRLVRTLVDGNLPAGVTRLAWDGHDSGGSRVRGGVYFLEARSGGRRESHRIVAIR